MNITLPWDDASSAPASASKALPPADAVRVPSCAQGDPRTHRGGPELPAAVERALWRANELGSVTEVLSTGFAALDAELPGGGWPCRNLTEVLLTQPAVLEWRLLGPTLGQVVRAGQDIMLISPPRQPHLPGLRHIGVDERHLVWIKADAPAQRLWCAEQVIRSGSFGAVLAWLPQARPEQVRRLQVLAQGCEGVIFLIRSASARHEASAAPLRLEARTSADWELQITVVKRRGPAHEGQIRLRSVPGGLDAVLTRRTAKPSDLLAARARGINHAVGSPVATATPQRLDSLQ